MRVPSQEVFEPYAHLSQRYYWCCGLSTQAVPRLFLRHQPQRNKKLSSVLYFSSCLHLHRLAGAAVTVRMKQQNFFEHLP